MTELITMALATIKEVLPMIPNYEQRKEKDYEELCFAYVSELEAEHPDLRLLAELGDKLMCEFRNIKSQVGRK